MEMGNWDVSKPNNDGERELLDRAVKALETEFATKTCNKQIASKLEDAELARDSEGTCNNKQVISKLVASKDAISRAEVHDLLATWLSDKLDDDTREVLEVIDGKVEDMSPVTPKKRTGHWILVSDGTPGGYWKCSECLMHKRMPGRLDSFCSCCGADMQESEEQA